MDTQGKRLYRKESDRLIAGVCSGLAEYFGLDVTLVRVVFAALGLSGGTGILLYVLLWIFVPLEP